MCAEYDCLYVLGNTMAVSKKKATLNFWTVPRELRDVIYQYAYGSARITRRHVDAGAMRNTTSEETVGVCEKGTKNV